VKIQLWRRRQRLGNFLNFLPVGGGAAVFISYQRRRLGNFKNFLRLGGGGSADRLTPLVTLCSGYVFLSILTSNKHFFRRENPNLRQNGYHILVRHQKLS
jgi:hypothetical protein